MFAGRADHKQSHFRPRDLGVEGFENRERILDVGPAPGRTRLGDAEIAAGSGAPTLHLDSRWDNAEQFASLMLGEDAGDVVVDHDDLVNFVEPLLGEHADRGRAAADAHAFFADAIHDRGLAGLNQDGCAAVDRKFDRLLLAKVQQGFAGDGALLTAAAGQVANAAEGKHLRTVFAGRDVPDGLALGAHRIGFRTEMAVGIDLQLHAAVTEDALGHHRHHIDALHFGRNDERCGLVVRIGRARADGGDELVRAVHDVPIPFALDIQEWNERVTARDGLVENHVRIDAHELAVGVGIAVAGPGASGLDIAEDRAGITTDGVAIGRVGDGVSHSALHCGGLREWPRARGPGWPGRGGCELPSRGEWR